ncbi:hypothetical protein [Amycolatopsis sp. NPDC098790]|uniref:hypothetical protein n=1 Tax=Amycolatopsis sp. NPDC098790 TaxID=3363939 RepID=UPI0037F6CB95
MRRLAAAILLVLGATACGRGEQPSGAGDALCSPSYAPKELVDNGNRTTDADAIKKVAAAACSLPAPPRDVACTLELGPTYELRFVDAGGRTTTLTAESYGCQFVEGLGSRRFDARPLWDALIAAGLPAPDRR